MPVLCTLVVAPAAALARTPHAGSGGGGIGSGGSSLTTTTTTSSPTTTATTTTATTPTFSAAPTTPGALAPGVIALAGTLKASGDGISVTVAASGTQGHPLTISGLAPAGSAGGVIDIQEGRPDSTSWLQVATATVATNGSFTARWIPSSNGQMTLRAALAPEVTSDAATAPSSTSGSTGLGGSGGGSAAAATTELSTAALTIPIFKNAVATMYGPGFWGHHTACGQRLTRTMLGIASRTLKCGTEVAVLYGGHELTVPVIDRGPFTNGVSWDLTMATAKALGITETSTIGTLTSATAPAFATGS